MSESIRLTRPSFDRCEIAITSEYRALFLASISARVGVASGEAVLDLDVPGYLQIVEDGDRLVGVVDWRLIRSAMHVSRNATGGLTASLADPAVRHRFVTDFRNAVVAVTDRDLDDPAQATPTLARELERYSLTLTASDYLLLCSVVGHYGHVALVRGHTVEESLAAWRDALFERRAEVSDISARVAFSGTRARQAMSIVTIAPTTVGIPLDPTVVGPLSVAVADTIAFTSPSEDGAVFGSTAEEVERFGAALAGAFAATDRL